MKLTTKVSQLNRVGEVLARRLKHLGIETVEDLLFYYPFRYEDFSQSEQIKKLKEGEQVTVRGKVELIANKRSPRKGKIITEAVVADDADRLRVVWFGQPFIAKTIHVGDTVFLSGKVSRDMFGLVMKSPSYEKEKKLAKQHLEDISSQQKDGDIEQTHTGRLVPIYSLTAGITQKQLRFLISQVISLSSTLEEWLPVEILEGADLIPIQDAVKAIHFPEDRTDLQQAKKRLKFDELFILQLRAEMIRQSIKREEAPKLVFQETLIKEFVQRLPFTLTNAQKIATWEILQDIQKSEPMNRLLEGDVGSGKTVVAAMCLYNAVLNGYQGVLMAPTEILAKQHFESIVSLLGEACAVALLTGSETGNCQPKADPPRAEKLEIGEKTKKGKRAELLKFVKNGTANIIVGTHALLVDEVKFKQLGLVIVDEQHRFGVEQRKTIREKSGVGGMTPHFLSMTATPIPRSFALTLYGDLDLSIINQMPANRKPIQTRLVDPHQREKAYGFIRSQVKEGRQVFVICPLISKEQGTRNKEQDVEPSRLLSLQDERKTVMEEYEKLKNHVFPDLRVGYLHGKMKSAEKDVMMKQFAAGEIDILVSTSVVEVGVNIPNASVMMIEGAERFGLAQLHQFRGRVGRSEYQSYCFLFTESQSDSSRGRLEFFEKTLDGFKLAEYDLNTRGPGEVYGTSQSGLMNFRLASMKDTAIIKLARDTARGIDFEKYPLLKEKVKEWEGRVHLE